MPEAGERPRDRSPWWRTGAGLAAWLALAVAASGAAWAAVAVVGDQGDPTLVGIPSSGNDSGEASEDPSNGGDPTTPGSTRSGSPDAPSPRELLPSAGGWVIVRCTSTESVERLSWSASPGWRAEVESDGPDEVEVEFVAEDDESRIRARCRDGLIESDIDDDR